MSTITTSELHHVQAHALVGGRPLRLVAALAHLIEHLARVVVEGLAVRGAILLLAALLELDEVRVEVPAQLVAVLVRPDLLEVHLEERRELLPVGGLVGIDAHPPHALQVVLLDAGELRLTLGLERPGTRAAVRHHRADEEACDDDDDSEITLHAEMLLSREMTAVVI
ncbi:hypothetical protein ACN28I_08970 [Archangium gephyra]|uniref:hypothetical protein n=1 Tax=Archangium gephyra TaxID=48 RepID=UPI003B8293E9